MRVKTILLCGRFSGKVVANFYKVIVMSVLLYGSETWVLNGTMKNKLKTFHHRIIRSICGCYPEIDKENGLYKYPSITNAMNEIGMEELDTYINKRRNTLIETMNKIPEDDTIYSNFKDLKHGLKNVWWNLV